MQHCLCFASQRKFCLCELNDVWDSAAKSLCVQALLVASNFNAVWDTNLKLFENDCRDHCRALARLLLDDRNFDLPES